MEFSKDKAWKIKFGIVWDWLVFGNKYTISIELRKDLN